MQTRLLAGWKHLTEAVAAAAFMLMFTAFIIQIISRYIFSAPVAWSLELCSIGYVWVVFWSCNLLLGERQHIIFDVIYQAIPAPARRWLALSLTATLGLVFLAALPGTLDYVWFLRRRESMMLQIPMHIVYACFVVFMIAVAVGAARRVRNLAGPSWQSHL